MKQRAPLLTRFLLHAIRDGAERLLVDKSAAPICSSSHSASITWRAEPSPTSLRIVASSQRRGGRKLKQLAESHRYLIEPIHRRVEHGHEAREIREPFGLQAADGYPARSR